MKRVRPGVFETNSSSTHSIKLIEGDTKVLSMISPNDEGVIEVMGDEFAWEYATYTDPRTKLSYLITFIFEDVPDNEDIESFLRNNDKQREYFDKVKRAVKEHTGSDLKVVKNTNSFFKYGYVDHQSAYIPHDILEGDIEGIKRFVFNPLVELIIDNDNKYD